MVDSSPPKIISLPPSLILSKTLYFDEPISENESVSDDISKKEIDNHIRFVFEKYFKTYQDVFKEYLSVLQQYTLPDTLPAEQLAQSCLDMMNAVHLDYIKKANEQDKKMNEITRWFNEFKDHQQKFEKTIIQEISLIKQDIDDIKQTKNIKKKKDCAA